MPIFVSGFPSLQVGSDHPQLPNLWGFTTWVYLISRIKALGKDTAFREVPALEIQLEKMMVGLGDVHQGSLGFTIEIVGAFLNAPKKQLVECEKRGRLIFVSWWSYDWWLNVSKICLEGFEANLVGVYPHGLYLHQDIGSNPWVWDEGLWCQIPNWFAYLMVISSLPVF